MKDDISDKESLLKNLEITDELTMNLKVKNHNEIFVTVENFQSYYDDIAVNKPVSFAVKQGEVFTIQGDNGSGKTTLIKALIGDDIAYQGSFKLPKNLKITYLKQDISDMQGKVEQLCVENKISANEVFSNLRKLGFERILFNNDVATMSQGQKKKVALAICLAIRTDLYIFDEPLNYLDLITRQQIISMIKEYKPTIVLIDHDIDFINEISVDKIELEPVYTIEK